MNQQLLRALIEADQRLVVAAVAAIGANRPDVADEINEARLHLTAATSLVAAKDEP